MAEVLYKINPDGFEHIALQRTEGAMIYYLWVLDPISKKWKRLTVTKEFARARYFGGKVSRIAGSESWIRQYLGDDFYAFPVSTPQIPKITPISPLPTSIAAVPYRLDVEVRGIFGSVMKPVSELVNKVATKFPQFHGYRFESLSVQGQRISIFFTKEGSITIMAVIAGIIALLLIVGLITISYTLTKRSNNSVELSKEQTQSDILKVISDEEISPQVKEAVIAYFGGAGSTKPSTGIGGIFDFGGIEGTIKLAVVGMLAITLIQGMPKRRRR